MRQSEVLAAVTCSFGGMVHRELTTSKSGVRGDVVDLNHDDFQILRALCGE